ncbi:bifunctional folylpolyglutamate synthase/dihydrofolate synthase [Allomuricauda sp. SCSIO 65647]|uniref:bifunctional folylpolyglutamate synthase/dihydrofolate synthase n=1 Tax=Allomuricauda sp. SCSIO 65647 TaxID=2908843 RepID=UPI001F39497C|nr:folylpolyglutamate synthase/dihydrofolate synthase family protein [Muricauda sp. SCSIO 65647]UJH66488.1 bifunctional folylpolyglutamate synthase/dihydrofolate synthase [Muricauda sp. SCSIO 65647]
MTYKQTLDFMFAQLPMYQQKGVVALNAKLDNIKLFAERLGSPERKFKSIHVAGTNGKGSSSHMLASVLQEAGYEVGLYTSPHLKDFRERIKINGESIPKENVQYFIENHKSFLKENKLSFFEMTVGMAFDYFANRKVDIAIIEVGLGGRLDSTNIIEPLATLITNIGFDHMDVLGDTLEKIAFEKAGTIKKGVPVVISETQTETETVFKGVAAQHGSRIIFADQKVSKQYKTDLLGHYQKKNMLGVVACLKELKGFAISDKDIEKGLRQVVKNTRLLGRWQILAETPYVVCDTAHNTEGIKSVLAQIAHSDFVKLHMVLGFVDDKRLDAILPLFPKKATYYFVRPNVPRGLGENELKSTADGFGLKGDAYRSVSEGFEKAVQTADKDDFVFVGGSTFVVAEVV